MNPEQSNARRMLAALESDVLRLTQSLVRANTVAVPPRGAETTAQNILRDFLRTHGVTAELYPIDFIQSSGHHCVRYDRDYSGRLNLSARIEGSGTGKSLILNGHVDTVPAGPVSKWTHDPWSATIADGRMYGLGAFDMKAGVAAQAAVLAALQRSGVKLAGDVLLQSVVDEEWGGGGGTLAALLRGERADAAVVSEGTQLEVWNATRGGFVVDLEVEAGDPTKYFSSGPVISPAIPLGRLLGWIEACEQRRPYPVQVLAIEANRFDSDVPLSVPLVARVRVYFQFGPEENVDGNLRETRRSLDAFAAADPFFARYPIWWKPMYDPPLLGHELPVDHPWTECVASAAKAKVAPAPYPCDAFLLQREFGIPTLLYGPAGGGAHNPDEYVEVDSILKTAEGLLAAALQWCS